MITHRRHGDPVRQPVAYGALECCERGPRWAITRTDAMGTQTYLTCDQHRDEAALTAGQYVDGWGDLTMSVTKHEGGKA